MHYAEIAFKAVMTYFLMIVFMKVIGTTGFAQLAPYDMTFILIIAAVIAAPLTDPNTSYIYSLIVFFIGLAMQQLFSRLSLKDKIRPWIEAQPMVMVIDGKIIKENMKKAKYDMVQLMTALRLKGVKNLDEVELGTLEPNGDFSVISKSNNYTDDENISTYLELKQDTYKNLL